ARRFYAQRRASVPRRRFARRILRMPRGRFVMSAPIPLRRDFGASQLSGLAKKTKDGPQARRLLLHRFAVDLQAGGISNANTDGASPMPTDKGLGPDDRDHLQDRWKPSIQLDQEQPIPI